MNNELISNHVLEPGFPRKISIDMVHHLEFWVLDRKRGIYIDGHEREDVVTYKKAIAKSTHTLGKWYLLDL